MCRYFACSPSEYKQLRWDEVTAMCRVLQNEIDANKKASRRR